MSLNSVQLIGRLGQDPEMKHMPSGEAVANLSIATSERWKDKQGQKQERTEWHRVALFGRVAEIADEYLSKGDMVFIGGSIRTRKWQDKTGADRYSTEIVGRELKMLVTKGKGKPSAEPAPATSAPPETEPDLDDDIPF